MDYAELQVTTNFSFLRGASHPQELVAMAKGLGLAAIGVADRNSLAGVVRAHVAAKAQGMRLLVGVRLDLTDGPSLLCYPEDRAAYGRLCRLLTLGQRRADKGCCEIGLDDVYAYAAGQVFIALPPDRLNDETAAAFGAELAAIKRRLEAPLYLAAQSLYRGDDRARLACLAALAQDCGTPLLASNDVLYHSPARRPLQDVLTCIREKCTIREAGYRLLANAERHLKSAEEMTRLFKGWEDAVGRSLEVVERCRFSLDELSYEYPDEPVPPDKTPQRHLEDLAWAGAAEKYPEGVPSRVENSLRHELRLIAQLGYAPYFLTVHDIVRFARSKKILCQGRGSAANSAVCYCLGITNVDPSTIDLLFERFLSAERNEPPDIDVDFEHERREEVMQYIYERYGRERAGLTATVISYRARSAVREVGKAMGLSEDTVAALASTIWGSWGSGVSEEQVAEAGLDLSDPQLARVIALTEELIGFPRHLSQHVGGFVLTQGPLNETVPIGNAAMADRTFIEWDKDDIQALGIMKVDVLALGMLTCIRKCFDLLAAHYDRPLTLASVPREDAAVYDMLCRADSIGVFQVESRAQMNMLPRLKPRCFYDLVIEVAIVRPGPIQGDMVHPYLRRRDGLEAVSYPAPSPEHGPEDELKRVLEKTLGVPLFQEQAMRIAIEAAKFTPDEANLLRHAMATFRRRGTIETLKSKMVDGMIARGYAPELAERCFKQIEGFGEYGFPESHAASFSHLVYISAWLKCHYPAVFACSLLNSQPMGFYAPAQLVRDAREHGVTVYPADVNRSGWDNTLEPDGKGDWALRLGLRQIDGFAYEQAKQLLGGRQSEYRTVEELQQRSGVAVPALEKLAAADAFRSLGLDRRQALWAVRALARDKPLPLFAHADAKESGEDPAVALPEMPLSEHVVQDYQTLRLSLKAHPMQFLRGQLEREGIRSTLEHRQLKDGARLAIAGVVLVRQRPGSAKGVVFMTIEDECGIANAVVWPKALERYRKAIMASRLILIRGRIQKHGEIIHVVAERLEDRTWMLDLLSEDGEGASTPLAHADEVRRPGADPYPPQTQEPVLNLPTPAHSQPPSHSPNRSPGRHPRDQRIIPKSRDFH